MTHPILYFDFNGVISYNNFWHDIYSPEHELYERREEINSFVFSDNIDIVKEWMVGKRTAEDIHQLIEEGLRIKSEKLFPIFEKGARELDISEKILSLLRNKKSDGYKVVLITDNMDSFPRFTRISNPILDETFDAIYDSFTTGLLKKQNSGEIFKKIAEDMDGDIEKSFLFDDSLSNCTCFEEIGGQSRNVRGEDIVLEELSKI